MPTEAAEEEDEEEGKFAVFAKVVDDFHALSGTCFRVSLSSDLISYRLSDFLIVFSTVAFPPHLWRISRPIYNTIFLFLPFICVLITLCLCLTLRVYSHLLDYSFSLFFSIRWKIAYIIA